MIWFIHRPQSKIGVGNFLQRPLIFKAICDNVAYRRFFILGWNIFIRTALLILCEAMVLNQAAKLSDLDLATCQLILTLFGGQIALQLDLQ